MVFITLLNWALMPLKIVDHVPGSYRENLISKFFQLF